MCPLRQLLEEPGRYGAPCPVLRPRLVIQREHLSDLRICASSFHIGVLFPCQTLCHFLCTLSVFPSRLMIPTYPFAITRDVHHPEIHLPHAAGEPSSGQIQVCWRPSKDPKEKLYAHACQWAAFTLFSIRQTTDYSISTGEMRQQLRHRHVAPRLESGRAGRPSSELSFFVLLWLIRLPLLHT
jgi:hypothetical protein